MHLTLHAVSLARLGALLLLALAVSTCGDTEATRRRSVLVIVVDSLHAGHVSSHGYSRPTTPNFDRFAARGVRFESAYSQSSWTLPSTASLFTALEQERHGVRTFDDGLSPELATVAERFANAGYGTCALVQTPVLSSRHGLDRGFERYTVLDHSPDSLERTLELARGAWTRAPHEPLFLYVHLAPPHMPYQPPAPHRGRFSDPASSIEGSIAECRRIHRARLAPEHPDVTALVARYDEHVAHADATVGRLLEQLGSSGARKDAWVVWTSDHGEAFLQHGSQGHNATVFEEMIHVPLALAPLAGESAARVVREPVSTMDIAPTVLELCGLGPLPGDVAGRTLAPALRGDALPHDRLLAFSSRYKADERELQLAVRRGALKLAWSGATSSAELYDLYSDPRESRDASPTHPEALAELSRELERFRAELRATTPAKSLRAAPQSASRERLAELGYVDD